MQSNRLSLTDKHYKRMLMMTDIIWDIADKQIAYLDAIHRMDTLQADIYANNAQEMVWLLEHPPLFTGGTSADSAELLHNDFPVYNSDRGGRYTYHGPGQRIGYVMLDLSKRRKNIRHFIHAMEDWIIDSLAHFDIKAHRAEGRVGIWCINKQGKEAKIGAIGVRIKRWVTAHGFAVNIDPDLSHFNGIVPCGLPDYPITSFRDLGLHATIQDFDAILQSKFPKFLDTITHK